MAIVVICGGNYNPKGLWKFIVKSHDQAAGPIELSVYKFQNEANCKTLHLKIGFILAETKKIFSFSRLRPRPRLEKEA